MTETTVAVVPEGEALEKAYRDGFERFDEAPDDALEGPGEPFGQFTGSAEYVNTVAPRLRALAGYVDSGTGTYRVERKVVVVSDGDEDDLPRDAREMRLSHVYEAIQEAYRAGAEDKLHGEEYGESLDDLYI
jgi:hypothetical protein